MPLDRAVARFNRIATIPAWPVERIERLSRNWVLGLLAPLIGRRLRARELRGERPVLPAELVQRLDGLPAATALRGVLDEAWQSTLLPARAKALVFAVVARGIGALSAEGEAARLLEAGGMRAAEIQQTLAHLGSGALDALEPGSRTTRCTRRWRCGRSWPTTTVSSRRGGCPPSRWAWGSIAALGVAGLVGSQDLVQFTVVGSTVNVAARVQDLTRTSGADILVTEPVRDALDPRFRLRALAPAALRGIAEPVRVWAVEDFAATRETAPGGEPG